MGYQIVIVIVASNQPSCQEVKLVKLQFIALACEMQNAECRMQNECVFYENNLNCALCAHHHSAFCILNFAFRSFSCPLNYNLNGSTRKKHRLPTVFLRL